MNITIWLEHTPQEANRNITRAYPHGMCHALKDIFNENSDNVRLSYLTDSDYGLSDDILKSTDVLLYWAHCKHDQLPQEVADRVKIAVDNGMGIILLHSTHFSKPFKTIIGTSGSLEWREDGRHQRLYNINPHHTIASGIPKYFTLPKEEMYGEYFDIPTPDELIFLGWYPGGELFRSGFVVNRGKGKAFYFQPGHETYPTYYNVNIRKIIRNAAHYLSGTPFIREDVNISAKCNFAPIKEGLFGLFKRTPKRF